MGSSAGLFLVGPTKVKTHKTIIFPEGSLKVENNDFSEQNRLTSLNLSGTDWHKPCTRPVLCLNNQLYI